jgi:DNA-directed RNA polymerase beta' subunit
MLASNNVCLPATGRPIITPSQDMVLGCYYLTAENPYAAKGSRSNTLPAWKMPLWPLNKGWSGSMPRSGCGLMAR